MARALTTRIARRVRGMAATQAISRAIKEAAFCGRRENNGEPKPLAWRGMRASASKSRVYQHRPPARCVSSQHRKCILYNRPACWQLVENICVISCALPYVLACRLSCHAGSAYETSAARRIKPGLLRRNIEVALFRRQYLLSAKFGMLAYMVLFEAIVSARLASTDEHAAPPYAARLCGANKPCYGSAARKSRHHRGPEASIM